MYVCINNHWMCFVWEKATLPGVRCVHLQSQSRNLLLSETWSGHLCFKWDFEISCFQLYFQHMIWARVKNSSKKVLILLSLTFVPINSNSPIKSRRWKEPILECWNRLYLQQGDCMCVCVVLFWTNFVFDLSICILPILDSWNRLTYNSGTACSWNAKTVSVLLFRHPL